MKEKDIEKYLNEVIKKIGGITFKFISPNNVGVPDRIVILKGGIVHFVELKQEGKKPRKIQELQINKIKNMGCIAFVIDSKEMIDKIYLNNKGVF